MLTPTLRDRWRWWRWWFDEFVVDPPYRPGDPLLGKTRETRDRNLKMIRERQEAREPWPKKRYDWQRRRLVWVLNPLQLSIIKLHVKLYGPKETK